MNWIKVTDRLPPENTPVETKIDDERGERNIQPLLLNNRLWHVCDHSMYVYYNVTHWRPLSAEQKQRLAEELTAKAQHTSALHAKTVDRMYCFSPIVENK